MKESSKMSITLNKHQADFVNYFSENNNHGAVMVHPTGSGKTITSLYTAEEYLKNNPNNKVIFVVPKNLVQNIRKNLTKIEAKDESKYRIYSSDKFYYGYSGAFLSDVINYDLLDEDDKIDDKLKKDIDNNKFKNVMYSTVNCLLIVDEGHNYRTEVVFAKNKDMKNQGMKSYSMIRAANMADKVLILTATPLVNSTFDIANLISMTTVNNDGKYYSKREFGKILSNRDNFKMAVAGKFNFYHLSADDLKSYPTFAYINEFIRMPDSLYKLYMQRENYLEKFTDAQLFEEDLLSSKSVSFYTGIRMAANLDPEELDGLVSKSSWIGNFVKSKMVNGALTKKILIYSQFIKYGIDLVAAELNKIGVPFGSVTGSGSAQEKEKDINAYNSGDVKILLISKSGREGLDLVETDYVIIFENAWNVATENQVIGRAIRNGSHTNHPTKHVDIIRLFMVKPEEFAFGPDNILKLYGKRSYDGSLKSADLLLMGMSMKKRDDIKDLYGIIELFNTENSNEYNLMLNEMSISVSYLNEYLISQFEDVIIVQPKQTDLFNRIFWSKTWKIDNIIIQLPIFSCKSYDYNFLTQSKGDNAYFSEEISKGVYCIYLNCRINSYINNKNELVFGSVIEFFNEILTPVASDINTLPKGEILRLIDRIIDVSPDTTDYGDYIKITNNLSLMVNISKQITINDLLKVVNSRWDGYINLANWSGKFTKLSDFSFDLIFRSNFATGYESTKTFYIKVGENLMEISLGADENFSRLFNLFGLDYDSVEKYLYFMNKIIYPNSLVSSYPNGALLLIADKGRNIIL